MTRVESDTTADDFARGPLSGVTVLALEQAVAMPFCSFILAEMGATVIKVERVDGGDIIRAWDHAVDGLSTGYVWLTSNKKDVAIDLRRDEGRELVKKIAAQCDVLVENFSPGATDRLGLGYDAIRTVNPALVYCSLSGYGHDGPYAQVKAYDNLIQGESGILLSNGYPDAPAKVALPITDLIGGITCALGVVAALRKRDRTGVGEYLDVSMLDAAASWLGYFPQHFWHGGNEPPRTGMRHQYIVPYGPYLASDGRYVNIVVASPSHWEIFVRAVAQRPEWLDDARFSDMQSRVKHAEALNEAIETVIAGEPSGVWLERLAGAGLPYGEVRGIAEVLEHPQLVARQMFVEADSPVGILPVIRFALGSKDVARRIPELGEHTDEILASVGLDEGARAKLRARGVVG